MPKQERESFRDVIEKNAFIFYIATVIAVFIAGWQSLAEYRRLTKEVSLSQSEYAMLNQQPEILTFKSTQKIKINIPPSNYPTHIIVNAKVYVAVKEEKAKHTLKILVNDEVIADVVGHKGAHVERNVIELEVSGIAYLTPNAKHMIDVISSESGNQTDYRYDVSVHRRHDLSDSTKQAHLN